MAERGSRLVTIIADGSGAEEVVSDEKGVHEPESWSPDGTVLLFDNNMTENDIWSLAAGKARSQPYLQTPFREYAARFSPDGRWVAYVSDESGRDEVYVRPYPGPGAKLPVSTDGGREPVWSSNGRELFYRTGARLMAVPVNLGSSFTAGKAKLLFEAHYAAHYDTTDGEHFLMMTPDQPRPEIVVVQEWLEAVKRRTAGR
jgi:dipeptidyl aminopeptidase/acylaminoacyl peptidase